MAVILKSPMKCSNCGDVVLFIIHAPKAPGSKRTFAFRCPKGHLATDPNGGAEVVDLKDYDESKLPVVHLGAD
jgi:hypothetical protein